MVALATKEVLRRLREAYQAKHGQDDVTPNASAIGGSEFGSHVTTGSAISASGSHVTSYTPQHSDNQ